MLSWTEHGQTLVQLIQTVYNGLHGRKKLKKKKNLWRDSYGLL